MVAGNDNMLYSIVIVLTPTREATVRATRVKGTGDAAAPHSPPGYGGRGVSRPCVGVGKLSQDPPLRRGLVLRNPRSVFCPCHCAISAISAIWQEGSIRWGQAGSGDPAGAGPQQVAASKGFDEERPFGLRKTQRVVSHGGEGGAPSPVPRPAPGRDDKSGEGG